jgi:hypothetical protein
MSREHLQGCIPSRIMSPWLSSALAEQICAVSSSQNSAVAIAWYRQEQWPLLRAVSADGDQLETTYDEWHAFATQQVHALEARGIRVQKIEVDVAELTQWCEREGRAVDGDARAEYARRGLGRPL